MRAAAVLAVVMSFRGPLLADPPDTGLLGHWRVEHLHSDRESSARLSMVEDDPRYVGRFIDIGADRIVFHASDGDAPCGAPSLSRSNLTAGLLFGRTMAGGGVPRHAAVPADYGLPLGPGARVKVAWLRCGSGVAGPGFGKADTWLLGLPHHRLAMAYFGSTVLVLAPVPEGALPEASFACGKAATTTEKAICRSADLAGYDRSVAAGYADDLRQFAAIGDPAATAKLKASQKDWLVSRDRCAADPGCLHRSMAARLEVLADTARFTG